MSSFKELEAEARRQHPDESDAQIARRVAYRAATLRREANEWVAGQISGRKRSWTVADVAWQAVKILWAVAILVLLGAIAAKAEERKEAGPKGRPYTASAVNREEVLAGLRANPPAFDAPIIFLQDQTNQLAVIPAGKVIFNCSTNMACSWDSANRRFNMTASSTASTAFSALTASLNINAGTFSASGNSWDFTAATIFKVRAAAGATTSANGDLAFDSTASRWHIFQVSDRLLIPMTNVGVAGQAALSNADGTATFADPIVSGPTAVGAAPTTNPIYVAGDDGTNIRALRLFDADTGAGIQYVQGVELRKAASGGSVELGTATDPVRTDPTGTTTQPVSLAAALPAGTNNIGDVDVLTFPDNEPFNVAQINGVAPLMGNGVTGTGSPRVTIASDNSNAPGIGASATGSAVPSAARYVAGNASGNLTGVILCDNSVVISSAASGSTQLVALTSGQTIYICSYNWMANGAVNVKLLYGTGTACATGPTDLTGAYNHTAQTGIAVTSPSWTGIKTATSNALCVNLSAAVQVSGVLTYTKF